jgi:hypothetical protein
MTLQIDDAFISKWHPKYDELEPGDEKKYDALVHTVDEEMKSKKRTISRETFLDIWKWKGAMRVIRHVRLDEYDSRYAEAFRRAAASEPPERKLAVLLGPGRKLPGVGAPTGSTIIHFIDPENTPIIDVRTVEVLVEARRISTKQRDLEHYEQFRKAIDLIRNDCPERTLRQIDRALFAYHKLVLDKKGQQHRKR